MITFRKAFALSLLVSIWQCYDESAGANTPHHNESKLNNSLNKNFGRILHERKIRNADLKKRINNLLNEDDNTFGERLNALAHDEHFRKQFNVLIRDDLFQKRFKEVIQDKHFQKQFDILKNNRISDDLQDFTPLYDNDSVHKDGDPFNSCNNLEELFDKLRIQKDKKEKQIEELKRDEEYKKRRNAIRRKGDSNENLREELKRTVYYARKPLHDVEYDIGFKLAHNEDLEKSVEDYTNDRIVTPNYASILPITTKKEMSAHELELLSYENDSLYCNSRYLCKRPRRHKNLLSFLVKHKVFLPAVCIQLGILTGFAILSAIKTIVVTLFPALAPLALVSFLAGGLVGSYIFYKNNKLSSRGIEYQRGGKKHIGSRHYMKFLL
ncbi:Plasmodium exported protein, unknown function [Plasmodium vivax]|uniref:Pv-fam-d protein n=1 Tax=Plasmodium vivax TaxID=5855 RepID=A0A1G4H404_PLAVI|nr:Plasmodium exported protein, unknown function [Plasmodium vivax]